MKIFVTCDSKNCNYSKVFNEDDIPNISCPICCHPYVRTMLLGESTYKLMLEIDETFKNNINKI